MAVLIVYTAIITPYSITFGRYDELDLASSDEPLASPRVGTGAGAGGLGGGGGGGAGASGTRADFREIIAIADLLADAFFVAGMRYPSRLYYRITDRRFMPHIMAFFERTLSIYS